MWFQKKPKPTYSVCTVCGVHFEPPTDSLGLLYKNLCGAHREPYVEAYRKQQEVEEWAKRHWKELYPKAKKENEKLAMDQAKALQQAITATTRGIPSCGCQHGHPQFQGYNSYIPGWNPWSF